MLSKLKKSNNEGFTIIEVMIVLAIAGLILLIVFLAVPALQRNGRNTQRKNDAGLVATALANAISNNNGTVPDSVFDQATTDTASFGKGTTGNFETAKLGYFTTGGKIAQAKAAGVDGNVWISAAASPAVAPTVVAPGSEAATKVSTNSILVIYGQDCTPTANARTAAIYYVTENGSGNGNLQCVEQ
ncbi:MAG: hypothetical protein JWO41_42 [Candidatus Saccharibacteria bacterium]|nr:hypothetical protein [Candidatus Saccharibacteria bacterium]